MLRGECFDEILWQRCNNKTRSSETRQEIGKLNSYETRSSEARQDSGRLNSSETRQESGNLNSSETRQGSGRVSSYECQLQERLVTLIATLPDRITGNLQAHARYVLKYRVTLVKYFSTVVMVGNIRSMHNSYLSRKAARIVQHWSWDET